jgi:hypothetical protein
VEVGAGSFRRRRVAEIWVGGPRLDPACPRVKWRQSRGHRGCWHERGTDVCHCGAFIDSGLTAERLLDRWLLEDAVSVDC